MEVIMRRAFTSSVLIFSLLAAIAQADHTLPSGTMNRLYQDTRNLYKSVMYSPLHNGVKQSVYYFRRDVENLMRCMQGPHDSATEKRDHDLLPEYCEHYLDSVHYSWYQVDRYLWDTNFDYPQVYYYYRFVRDDVRYLPH